MSGPTVIVGAASIRACQLCAQWAALRLELVGLTRRGRSMRALLAEAYGLPARAKLQTVAAEHVKRTREHCEAHGLPVPSWAQVPQ
jgi:hypothetical protein